MLKEKSSPQIKKTRLRFTESVAFRLLSTIGVEQVDQCFAQKRCV